jgi:single-stranded-DNA-specific exonuclease
MSARWILPTPHEESLISSLCLELGCPPVMAGILARRGILHAAEAANFLSPKLKHLSDPFLLPQMDAAVERTLRAIDLGERIVLYGDYDVDGVTSLALLTRMLRAYGADPQAFLPSRMEEGYGLSPEGVTRCVETFAPQLLIAVDCGTSSAAEIATLTAQGVAVVVIDHHECPATLPQCAALVNPKRADAQADFQYLCSAGLIFKFCHALLKSRPLPEFDLREHLDLVALGTVADIVPLTGENR